MFQQLITGNPLQQLNGMLEGLNNIPKPFCHTNAYYIHINAVLWYNKADRSLVLDGKKMQLPENEATTFFEAWLTRHSHQLNGEDEGLFPKTLVQCGDLFVNINTINYVEDKNPEGATPKIAVHYRKSFTELHGKTAQDFITFLDSRMADVDWLEENNHE